MVLTKSNPTTSHFIAPEFTLTEPKTGELKSLISLAGETATIIAFICNHCPFVHHINPTLISIATEFKNHGVTVIGISSNDATQYPQDGPEYMKQVNYPFAYLYDETQSVAQSYGAVCTPDFFVFDANMKLAYRGRLDGSTPGNEVVPSGDEMRQALIAITAGEKAPKAIPSIGCSIKWK